ATRTCAPWWRRARHSDGSGARSTSRTQSSSWRRRSRPTSPVTTWWSTAVPPCRTPRPTRSSASSGCRERPLDARDLGPLGPVSVLTLGGGGLGQVWGATTRDEAEATVRAAVDAGITLLDVAPGYGRGEAERVVGAAFGGRLPDGVRVGTKVMLGDPDGPVIDRIDAS